MNETRSQHRAGTAKRNDDSELIEEAGRESDGSPQHQGRAGGNLQRDVGTQADNERVADPEAHEGVTKEDDIAHGQRRDQPKPATHVVTERN